MLRFYLFWMKFKIIFKYWCYEIFKVFFSNDFNINFGNRLIILNFDILFKKGIGLINCLFLCFRMDFLKGV